MNIRTNAAAFVIWRDCKDHGWNRTIAQIAETTGMSAPRVNRVLGLAGWRNRVRVTRQYDGMIPSSLTTDEEVADLTATLVQRAAIPAE